MPANLSPAQLKTLSRVTGTRFFVWADTPASQFYHMMVLPDGDCHAVKVGWYHHSYEGRLPPAVVERRFGVLSGMNRWVDVSHAAFCGVMERGQREEGFTSSEEELANQLARNRIALLVDEMPPYTVNDFEPPPTKRPDPRLKTNHKLGAPKGKLP